MISSPKVCDAAELPAPGGVVVVRLNMTRIAIFNVDGALYAVDDLCSHGKASLALEGRLEGDVVQCTRHGAQFHLPTGEVRCPPAVRPLATYDIVIESGAVFLEERRSAS